MSEQTVETTQPAEARTLKEGDVYRFRYSEQAREKWRTDPYWCFDGQVVVHHGMLLDTYWGFPPSHSEQRIVRPDEGELTFVCNMSDVRDIQEYETRHYDAADVFNLTHHHGHRKRFVVRKEAAISVPVMLDAIRRKEQSVRQEMERAIRSGGTDLIQLGELRARIEAGDLNRKPWW